jgi:molybdate transport system substrate-binding protein
MGFYPGARATACAAGLLALMGSSAPTKAAELIVLTSMGPATGVYELAAGFEKASNNKVTVTFETATSLNQKLDSNAPADLITGGPEQIADLIKKGKVVGANTPFGVAGLGLSVKVGAPRPDISTVEAYKAALLAAKSVGYSRGCSGTNTAEGIEKLGIGEQMKSKTKLTGGGPVAEYLAKGDFELGIQQTNVLVGVPGTDYVGPLPGFLNKPCPFNVGVMAVSKQPDLARALMAFMTSSDAVSLLQKGHMEPPKRGS